jgi:hypothetical protein
MSAATHDRGRPFPENRPWQNDVVSLGEDQVIFVIPPGRDGLFSLVRSLPETLRYKNLRLCKANTIRSRFISMSPRADRRSRTAESWSFLADLNCP